MSETKEQVTEQRDALLAEVERLRGQLAAAGTRAVDAPAAHRFFLSEGGRQELELYGVVNIGGKQRTRDEVLAMLDDSQAGVEIAEVDPGSRLAPARPQGTTPGVDFVYPSVAPGELDPAVAGTPGVSGPAAE